MMGMMVQEILLQLKEEFGKGKTEVMEELELKNRQTYNNWFAGVKPTHENAYKLDAFLERCKREKKRIEERLPPTQFQCLEATHEWECSDECWDLLLANKPRPDKNWIMQGLHRRQARCSMDYMFKHQTRYGKNGADWRTDSIWKDKEFLIDLVAKWHPDIKVRNEFKSLLI